MELKKVVNNATYEYVVKVDDKFVKEERIYLNWENINVYTPDPNKSCFSKVKCLDKKPNESKHIIKNG